MGHDLQIWILERDPADADRLMHELARQGFVFQARRIETREEFLRHLEGFLPDLILSDHGVPAFTGFAALEIAQEKCPQVPFIFVTGSYDQGLVVEMFDCGAAGCVHKNRLAELAPVIRQAQEEVHQRRQSIAEEVVVEARVAASRPSPARPGLDPDLCLICSRCKKVRDERGDWEDLALYLRRHQRATVTLALCPVCAEDELHLRAAAEAAVGKRFITPKPSRHGSSG